MINWRSIPREPYNSTCELLAGFLYALSIGTLAGKLFLFEYEVAAICVLITFPIPVYYIYKGIRGFISMYRLNKILKTLNFTPSRN